MTTLKVLLKYEMGITECYYETAGIVNLKPDNKLMMKILPAIALMLLTSTTIFSLAQQTNTTQIYTAIDTKMLAIPTSMTNKTDDVARYINSNFSTEKDKVRAIFIWVASSFEYDVDNMYALNYNEKREEKIRKIMMLKKGICENYAAVFDELCNKCGIKSWIVGGYTRHNGQTADLAHAWCAVLVDGEYRLVDPTWGSGYINDNKFTRKIDNKWFMQSGESSVKTHMPFDPMWQMVYYPVSTQNFASGKTEIDKSGTYFSYPDSIAAYEKLTHLQQMEAEARRMEANGVKTTMAYNYFTNLKGNIDVARQNELINTYNDLVGMYNEVVHDLNQFINYRNKQFSPTQPDAAIQKMVDVPAARAEKVENGLMLLKGKDKRIDDLMAPMLRSVKDAQKTLDEQRDFLKKYFSKSKLGRKSMFYKYSWMGVPLN